MSSERGRQDTVDSNHTLNDSQENVQNQSRADGGEKGEKDGEGPSQSVGFWHKELAKTRMKVFMLWARTVLILATFILAILSLYWGVLNNVEQNMNSLIVFVIDFDNDPTPLVGPLVTKTTEAQTMVNQMPHLGYITIPPSAYDFDPMNVRRAVYEEQAWAAIVVNANATTLLRQAVEQGNSSYDPLGAMQLVYEDARDQTTVSSYILPQLSQLQTEITSMFGEMWTAQVLQNTSISRTNLQKVPQALSPAIGFSTFNLRPFTPASATPAVTIGLIYLIIIAFFSFTFFLPIYMQLITPKGHAPLHVYQFILTRYIMTIFAYFFMSLAYSLVSLAFQIPFSNPSQPETYVAVSANPLGHATFVVYWMINFIGMIALGLACENVAMIIGQPWTAMWLIFWVITNVSTSFYAIELSPGFFHWGYAWPLHHIVQASRTVIFDLQSHLGLNFGVLFGWVGVNTLFFPFCCWFMKWKTERAKKKEAEKEE